MDLMQNAEAYLSNLLLEYRKLERQQRNELKRLPPGQLTIRRNHGAINYIQLLPAEIAKSDEKSSSAPKRIRRGITRNQDMIRALARKRYLQESLALLEKNIPALKKFIAAHEAPTPDNLLKKISSNFDQLPPEMFLPRLQARNDWACADYRRSTYNPKGKIHMTGRGLRVRSKSEVIIAEKLDAFGVPFRYEQMLYIENYSFSPDFVMLQGEELKYWEHCGLVNDPAYMKRHKWKLNMYEKAGIVPWRNLIITYDDANGTIDSRIIEAEIKNKLL